MESSKIPQYDAIIAGSGPGGATVAKQLCGHGKKVLMLEWGSDAPLNGTLAQMATMGGIPGQSALVTYGGLVMVRGMTQGGSSVMYYATAFEPPHEMLASYGIDIKQEVKEARNELPIAPLADHLVGPMAKRIMGTAQEMGLAWNKLDKYVYQDKCLANCDKCNFGCPHGAKWTARDYVAQAKANGLIFQAHARVEKVLLENGKAAGVEYLRHGRRLTARAPVVIVAAGGIGSPVILRKTGIKEAGHDFFYDPLIGVMGTVDDIKGGKEFPMATGIHLEDDGYVMTDMTVPNVLYQAFCASAFRLDKLLSHGKTLQIMIKAKDSLGGRLTDSGGVRKRLAPEDKKKLMHGYGRAKGILEKAGARDIFKSWYIAAHPGGTVKIGDIVDSDLMTRHENLYVCDCSVIPRAWGLPPTLTLIGLGKRLAAHVAQKSGTKAKAA